LIDLLTAGIRQLIGNCLRPCLVLLPFLGHADPEAQDRRLEKNMAVQDQTLVLSPEEDDDVAVVPLSTPLKVGCGSETSQA
jgi:hypothetical protein